MNSGFLTSGGSTPNFEPTVLLDTLSNNIDEALNEAQSADSFLAGRTLAEIERCAIIATIRYCKGNKAASARSLGISEKSIYNKMRRLNISNADLAVKKPS
ncbi:MAG: helix-turn-helix domain-containing protein [Planctomycetota bacterium]